MPTAETTLLAKLIEKKCECLTHLRDLGRRQTELVGVGDVTQLLKVLAAKQQFIDILQTIERQLVPFRDQDPDQRQWASEADREKCSQQSNECQQLLKEIVAQEKQSEGRLVARRDEMQKQLQGAHHAHQARSAYTSGNSPLTGMLDLSSDS